MATLPTTITRSVEQTLATVDLELAEMRARQLLSVASLTNTGTGDIAHTFNLDQRFRLIFIRCHFSGGTGSAALSLSLDSGSGIPYDTQLFTISQAGTGKDVHLRIGFGDTEDPSAWTFRFDDKLRLDWINPDPGNTTWGLEVGLALAS